MKKILRNVLILFGMLLIAAGCSSQSEELDANVDTQEDSAATTKTTGESEDEVYKEFNSSEQILADNDDYKITYKKAVHTADEFDESMKFVFEFQNKSDVGLALMSNNDASVDGIMVDDLVGVSSPDIAAGKMGMVVLEFSSIWLDEAIGQEFPKFENNMEITLQVLDEDWGELESIPFTISFQ